MKRSTFLKIFQSKLEEKRNKIIKKGIGKSERIKESSVW